MISHKIELPEINEKIWRLKNELNFKIIDHNFSAPFNAIIASRGINTKEKLEDFLSDDIGKLNDPFLFRDMKKATARIVEAIRSKEKIVIFGDYDADGITATSALYLFLESIGADISYYVPDRMIDGYGISQNGINYAVSNNISLVITVDCGITAIEECEVLSEKNIDVILTDHHMPKEVLPSVFAMIVPTAEGETYPFKKLAGAGVAFKLIHALCIELDLGDEYLKYIDLVAIGTVADVVSLTEENRIIVKNGLAYLKCSENIGIKALLSSLNIKKTTVINTGTVGFQIAPRINAVGRLAESDIVIKLFTTKDSNEAEKIVTEIEKFNSKRQDIGDKILAEASEMLKKVDVEKLKVIVLSSQNWHPGVIGIVASKIMEQYSRPTVMISINDGIGKGSCRSIEGFNIFEALQYCADELVQFGGHAQAAGLTVDADKIALFSNKINEFAFEKCDSIAFVPKIYIDAVVDSADISLKTAQEFEFFEPTGAENNKPLCYFRNLEVAEIRKIGVNENHLKFTFGTDNGLVSAVAFNKGYLYKQLKNVKYVDVVANIDTNEWNNRVLVQLKVIDIKVSSQLKFTDLYYKSFEEVLLSQDWQKADVTCNVPLIVENVDSEQDCFDALVEYVSKTENEIVVVINSLNMLTRLIDCFKDDEKIALDLCFNKVYAQYNLNGWQSDLGVKHIVVMINPTIDSLRDELKKQFVLAGSWLNEEYKNSIINFARKNEIKYIDLSADFLDVKKYTLDKDEVRRVFQYIAKKSQNSEISANLQELAYEFSESYKFDYNIFKMKYSLQIISEMGFLSIYNYDGFNFNLKIQNSGQRKKGDEFENSPTYLWLTRIQEYWK